MLRNSTTESQIEEFENVLKKCVEELLLGNLNKTDRWGKLKLAFPIEHKDYANFILCRFKIPAAKASLINSEIEKILKIKLNATVIRYVLLSLTEEQFTSPYKKPEAFVPNSTVNAGGRVPDRASFGKKNSASIDLGFEMDSNINLSAEE